MEDEKVKILYTNWRGETAVRIIVPKEIIFIATEWHPEKQWCLIAFDVEKQAERSFACRDIKKWMI